MSEQDATEVRATELLAEFLPTGGTVTHGPLFLAAAQQFPHLTALARERIVAHALVLHGVAGKKPKMTRPVHGRDEPTVSSGNGVNESPKPAERMSLDPHLRVTAAPLAGVVLRNSDATTPEERLTSADSAPEVAQVVREIAQSLPMATEPPGGAKDDGAVPLTRPGDGDLALEVGRRADALNEALLRAWRGGLNAQVKVVRRQERVQVDVRVLRPLQTWEEAPERATMPTRERLRAALNGGQS